MKLVKEIENELLKRKEVIVSAEYDSNPGYQKIMKEILGKFKVEEEVVVIKKLENRFGSKEFLAAAFIYENIKDKERIEPKKKVKKE
jgi:ribosomal protein S24E